MGNYNKVILLGRVATEPEVRYTQSGKAVTNFTFAVNNVRNDEEVLFVNTVSWSKLAETCNTYLKVGDSALLDGRLVIRKYTDKHGDDQWRTEIVIGEMQMVGGKRDGETIKTRGTAHVGGKPNGKGGAKGGGKGRNKPAPEPHDELDDEDLIPF